MNATALLIALAMGATNVAPASETQDPVPTFHGETSLQCVDGTNVWVWSAEHCGETFALGEAESPWEASEALRKALDAHMRRTPDTFTCDADADVAE